MINCVVCRNPHELDTLAAYKGDRGICHACLAKNTGESIANDLIQIAEAAKMQSEKDQP